MAVKIAVDLNLFDIIVTKPHSLDELVQATGADRTLLKRILRAVTAIGWLSQSEADVWGPSPLTYAATMPPLKSWLIVHFDSRMQIYAEFPEWLKKHQYKVSWAGDTDNIFREVNGTDCWSYMDEHPAYSKLFDTAMSIQESFPPELLPAYPFPANMDGIKSGPEDVTLVDVGGGAGQAISAIRKSHPDLTGRIVVQDLPKTIEKLDSATVQAVGFEPVSHDFFKPQPVKNAKYYHLRRVLHDWNDEACLKILAALRPAFDPGYSKLIVVDFVLEDINPGPNETMVDLMMMTACDGAERSVSEWHALLGKAGFKIDQIIRADSGATAVIEASVA